MLASTSTLRRHFRCGTVRHSSWSVSTNFPSACCGTASPKLCFIQRSCVPSNMLCQPNSTSSVAFTAQRRGDSMVIITCTSPPTSFLGDSCHSDRLFGETSHFSQERRAGAIVLYRKAMDRLLARRHRLTDFFFSLPPLEPRARLERIFFLARQFVVELETHPINPAEYRFLTGGELFRLAVNCSIAPCFFVRSNADALALTPIWLCIHLTFRARHRPR